MGPTQHPSIGFFLTSTAAGIRKWLLPSTFGWRYACKQLYIGVSKSSQTTSTDRQPMALRECLRYAWQQGTSPLTVPSGVAVWTLGVAQHKCLSPRVSSHLRFQHGRETGTVSNHGKSRAETFEMLRRAYGNEAMCCATCFEWHARFKRGSTSLKDDERSGQPSTSSTPKNVETIRWLVHEDRRRTITETAQFYCSVLRRLREDIRRKRPELWRAGNWLLHDDNAPSHRALATREFLAHITTFLHPPFSPDLAPCDFFLFPKMKLLLNGRRFDRLEDIQRESQNVLGKLREQDFQHAFQQWQQRWDWCVAAQGDYFEGDAAQT